MKLYGVNIGFDFGVIEELEVVKETPKTFMVKRFGGRWEQRILKSEMALRSLLIFTTHKEAQDGLKKELIQKIDGAMKTIKRKNEEIQKYKSMLDDLENKAVTE